MLDINTLLKKEFGSNQRLTIRSSFKTFIVVFLAFCLPIMTWFASTSFRYEFTFRHIFERKDVSGDTVVIGIDGESSLFELQKKRPEMVEFIQKVDAQKPRALVLDILLSEESIEMLESKKLQSPVIIAEAGNNKSEVQKSGVENLHFGLPTLTTTSSLVGETETADRLFTKAFLVQWPNFKNQIPKNLLATPKNISIINLSDVEKNPQILKSLRDKNVFIGGIDPSFRDNYYLSNSNMYAGVLIHAFLFEQLLDWQKYNHTAKLVIDNLVFIFFVGLVFWSFYVIISSYWQKLIYILFFWVVFFYMVSFRVFSINFGLAFLFLSILVWSGENIIQNWLLKDILKKYTPTFLWNFIEDGQNLDHIEDYRDVAVMFSDIRNFTAKSEENEDLMLNLLGDCLELQSSIVFNNYGTVDKFIGDAVMAYWTGKDAVGNSLLAACQIIQKLKQNEFISANGIEIGIGINYGKANLKNFGSKENKNFTLFGDSVNIASRIENLNKIYQTRILITEDSIRTISDEQRKLFVFGQIDTIRPKGKKMPIKIYEIYAYYDGHKWFEISRQKRPINDKYEEALDLYYKGDFERALEKFKIHPKITKFKLMIERCYKLLIKKPNNWNGVWEYKGK